MRLLSFREYTKEEELSALVAWRMVYSIMQVMAEERSNIEAIPCKASL